MSAGADTATIRPGGQLTLNFSYADGRALAGYYLAVAGADDYFDLPFSGESGASGQTSLSFQIPESLGTGSFAVVYCVYNDDGQVSNVITTTISLDGDAPDSVETGGEDSSIGDGGEIAWTETAVSLRDDGGTRYAFDCSAGGAFFQRLGHGHLHRRLLDLHRSRPRWANHSV